ncbi:hypothetical protein Salat_2480100 [Sesamum alatum]|uniref:Uncharacterized protein n=1 Tax=Sesamum alatum TaxID=300844 RepID=A0AAE1XRC1_9LAMI|nr:hypothetical protein Salat_2480100 [Sesamum alatum]
MISRGEIAVNVPAMFDGKLGLTSNSLDWGQVAEDPKELEELKIEEEIEEAIEDTLKIRGPRSRLLFLRKHQEIYHRWPESIEVTVISSSPYEAQPLHGKNFT